MFFSFCFFLCENVTCNEELFVHCSIIRALSVTVNCLASACLVAISSKAFAFSEILGYARQNFEALDLASNDVQNQG